MRIVLDTNVLVAAFASRGICAELVEHCLLAHENLLSPQILNETNKALESALRLPRARRQEILSYLKRAARWVDPVPLDLGICRDPSDDGILAAALAGGANCVVTGDQDLLILKTFRGIAILKPSDFWRFEQGSL